MIKTCFLRTVPVLLGYIPLGMAFGFLLVKQTELSWVAALVMSVVIYAGSGQFLAVSFFANGTGFFEIGAMTLLLNSRHSFYGLSLLDKFSGLSWVKPYAVFALTDETYALITADKDGSPGSKKKYYFYISLFNHLYWITGGFLGAFLGQFLPVKTDGMEFSLTALFVVLAIEQYQSNPVKIPFILAFLVGIAALIAVDPKKMLLVSISLVFLLLLLLKEKIR
ncbi:MAG: hypothetical protein A2Y41_12605 [Spirochaetes bacterium GWB1_36_13]|nr:MAG: hypothetical protein A2Y41_12605 [Spirochaetes bacterium GWB1_36_13]